MVAKKNVRTEKVEVYLPELQISIMADGRGTLLRKGDENVQVFPHQTTRRVIMDAVDLANKAYAEGVRDGKAAAKRAIRESLGLGGET